MTMLSHRNDQTIQVPGISFSRIWRLALRPVMARVNNFLTDKIVTMERWADRARQRRQLAQFGDSQLADIGRNRCDALQESGKSFWRK